MATDTSGTDGIRSAAGFVKGWLEARDIEVRDFVHGGRPVVAATVGATAGPTIVLHGHIDVVPGHPEQFQPRIEGDRLIGRGAYDMKGGLAAMMLATADLASQDRVKVHFVCVPDEESDEALDRASDRVVEEGYTGDFAITGEPTDLHIGVQAKGVLALRVEVEGKAAHGSTPWEGDNVVLKALDVFRSIESLPFTRESSDLFDRPSINLGRIMGGDVMNRVPERCVIDIDIRYLPGQDSGELLAAIGSVAGPNVSVVLHRNPALVDRDDPYVLKLARAVAGEDPAERISVGRDGASDAVSFLDAGIPAVEFGPVGGGHHGPEEWVSISSLGRHREALIEFVRLVGEAVEGKHLRIA
ncbi:MAG: M20/M25/M40 family metallo-hydrolase [Thermoleophilaceae bacterium]|nr:M20/M25/M40 family metallo-hydrolase [Thermoleophilaceae bacterium]